MDANNIEATETVPASRKLGQETAEELVRGAREVIICNRGKFVRYAGGDLEAVPQMLGRTGNLRAPCARVGDKVLVGFVEEAWGEIL